MLPTLLAAAVSWAPSPLDCTIRAEAAIHIGPEDAATRLDAFVDPATSTALASWLELRRIAAERNDLQIAVWFARPLGPFDPRAERVRRFVLAASRAGRTARALREVARLGVDRMAARVQDDSERNRLAADLDVTPAVLAHALADRCDATRISNASTRLAQLSRDATLGIVRLPAVALGPLVFDDAPGFDRVRAELGREPLRRALRRRVATPAPVDLRAAAERLRVPPVGGFVVGGAGLPHHLVVTSTSEDDAVLFLGLPRALAYRSEHPGELSIHVFARGESLSATHLRQRLCAATLLHRELDYARLLAGSPELRRTPDPDTSALLAELDAVNETRCADVVDAAREEIPEGIWLDGVPRSPTELEALANLLRVGQVGRRPLAPWWSPPAADP